MESPFRSGFWKNRTHSGTTPGNPVEDRRILQEAVAGDFDKFESGREIGGFLLVQEIGRGGTGSVWEAEQVSLKRRVALKLLKPQFRFSPTTLQRFQREAEAGGRLQHVGIVQTYGVGETDDVHWIAQELVPSGFTLADSLVDMRQQQAPPDGYYREVAELFARIADALSHAHANGVVHRDLKPGNILLTEEEQPKVADFGLAHVQDDLVLSRTGDFLGTPFYMSPEQAAAKRMGLDHRTDLFSLGATLYEALTLVRAFDGDTSQQVFHKILTEEPLDPRRIRSRVPRDLAVICHKCLEKSPDRRYPGMTELAADLRRFLNDEPILAKPPGPITRVVKWCRRHPVKSVTAAALLIGLPTISILGTWYVTHLDEVRAQQEAELIREAEELGQRGFLALYELDNPELAQALFQQALATHPGKDPDNLAGMAMAVAQADGPVAGIEVLHSRIAEWQAFPDLARVEAAILETTGREQEAELILSDLGQATTGIGWSLEGRRWLAKGENAERSEEDRAFANAQNAFHQAILVASRARMQDYFGMAHAMGHLRDPGPWLVPLVHAIEGLWPKNYVAALRRGFALGSELTNRGKGWRTQAQKEAAVIAYREASLMDGEFFSGHYNLGSVLYSLGRFVEAEVALRKAVQFDPDSAIAHYMLAAVLKDMGRPLEAELEFREAIHEDPGMALAHFNLGRVLKTTGRSKEAEREWREAIHLDPGFVLALHNLGFHLMVTGRQSEAVDVLGKAVELDPGDADVRHTYGLVLIETGRIEDAEAEFRTSIQLNPANQLAHFSLGRLFQLSGRREEAEVEYREAIRLGPDYPVAHYNLGTLLESSGRMDDAEVAYRDAIRLDQDYSLASMSLGNLLFATGRHGEAEMVFQDSLQKHPASADLHYNFGNFLLASGRRPEAEGEYRTAIRLVPNHPEAHCNLGLILLQSNRPVEALEHFRLGHDLGSRKPDWPYPSADWVRTAEQAVEVSRRLADLGSVQDWKQAFALARVAWSQGNLEGASRLESRGLELAREAQATEVPELGMWTGASAIDLNSTAWALVDPARPEKGTDMALALRLARAAVAAEPDDGSIRDTLAWALFANGRYGEALAEEEKAVELAAEDAKPGLRSSLEDLKRRVAEAQAAADPQGADGG